MRALELTAAAPRRHVPRRPGVRRRRAAVRNPETLRAIDALIASLGTTSVDIAPSLSGYIIVTGVAA